MPGCIRRREPGGLREKLSRLYSALRDGTLRRNPPHDSARLLEPVGVGSDQVDLARHDVLRTIPRGAMRVTAIAASQPDAGIAGVVEQRRRSDVAVELPEIAMSGDPLDRGAALACARGARREA